MPLSPAEIAAAHAANARWERDQRRRRWLLAAGYLLAALALAWYVWAVHHPAPERLPAYGARCADGWVSNASGQGACSHHGGVARWIVNGVEVCGTADNVKRRLAEYQGNPWPPEAATCTEDHALQRNT
jgi:hypothetical protein